tara:strand:- start:25676 stop:25957 length:282 start_codon:yes stop_codon:yes gene_type:complete
MHGEVEHEPATWAGFVIAAAPSIGTFPKLSIWHGDSDSTVARSNATELAKQWTALHGEDAALGSADMLEGHSRVRYGSPPVVELVTLEGWKRH